MNLKNKFTITAERISIGALAFISLGSLFYAYNLSSGISSTVITAAQHLCAPNTGLKKIEINAWKKDKYIFHCMNSAQFRDVSVEIKEAE